MIQLWYKYLITFLTQFMPELIKTVQVFQTTSKNMRSDVHLPRISPINDDRSKLHAP